MTTTAISPQQLVEAFMSYGPEQRDEFVRLFAQVCPHETPRAIIRHFPVAVKKVMEGDIYRKMFDKVLKASFKRAREILEQNPGITDQEFHMCMLAGLQKFVMDTTNLAAQEAKENLESKRNRKSDPETIRRNVDICKLNDEKPYLTHGQLGKQFNLSSSSIRDILAEKSKWFSLADKLTLKQ